MPLTIPDQSIASNVEVPNGMSMLSDIYKVRGQQQGLQQGQQAIQSNAMNLQSQAQANQERQNIIQLMQKDPSLKPGPDGTFDLSGDNLAKIQQAAPQTFNSVIDRLSTTNKLVTAAQQAKTEMTTGQRAIVSGMLSAYGYAGVKDPSVIAAGMDKLADDYGRDSPMGKFVETQKALLGMTPPGDHVTDIALKVAKGVMEDAPPSQQNNPQGLDLSKLSPVEQQFLMKRNPQAFARGAQDFQQTSNAQQQVPQAENAPQGMSLPQQNILQGQMMMSPGEQQTANTPSLQGVNTGQTQSFFNVKPGVQGIPMGQKVAQFQNQLPPTTPIMQGNQPGYLGATRGGTGFVPSGLPVGAPESIGGTVGAINTHWNNTLSSANSAQQDIGVLQNIKQHAAGAATGVGADRRALMAGIAGMIGMSEGEMEKTNTDLLAKNSNMLALAGGDTNLARSMAEAATPNSHMTKEAIIQAADQVIAQRKLALARAQFLTPFKAMADQGHPEMYNNALNQFNSVADPRVIQFSTMTPEEKSAMKSSMTPQERNDFGAKLGKARQLGIAQ